MYGKRFIRCFSVFSFNYGDDFLNGGAIVSGYLLTIIGTVLVCSLITAIAPEGKTTASVKGVAKLVCTLAIISPVLRFFKTGSIETLFDKNRQEI